MAKCFLMLITYSYKAFDFVTRLDAAGFIRPKIKISLPVGRGAHAERGSYEACTKKRAILQTTGVALLPSVVLKHGAEC